MLNFGFRSFFLSFQQSRLTVSKHYKVVSIIYISTSTLICGCYELGLYINLPLCNQAARNNTFYVGTKKETNQTPTSLRGTKLSRRLLILELHLHFIVININIIPKLIIPMHLVNCVLMSSISSENVRNSKICKSKWGLNSLRVTDYVLIVFPALIFDGPIWQLHNF